MTQVATKYVPLEVLNQAMVSEEIQKKAKAQDPMTADFLSGEMGTVDMDDFLNWLLGPAFLKSAYEGPYRKFNGLLLRLYHTRDAANGMSYAESRKKFRGICALRSIITCWSKEKQAYRFDPDFVEELIRTTSVNVPVGALMRLPFRCFYLDLEDLPFKPALGLFVYVGFERDTGLPNLGVLEVIPPKEGDDQYQLGPILYSARDMMKQGKIQEMDTGYALSFTKQDVPEGYRGTLLLFLLQAILYLSSDEPDQMESPKLKVVNTGKKRERKQPVTLTDIGVRHGTVIRKGKKQAQTRYIQTEPVGKRRRVKSHVRSAHWHHYWTGKGRTTLTVKWIPPVFVSGYGSDLPVTIHPVKKGASKV